MQVDAVAELIRQYRETMEGYVGENFWITDGKADSGVLGFIDTLTPAQALAAPAPGARSVAEHVAHLRFALDLTARRMSGENPPAPWGTSFDLPDGSEAGWQALKADIRRAYEALLSVIEQRRGTPLAEWEGIYVAGLSGLIGHNAYHLGAIRQIGRVVTSR